MTIRIKIFGVGNSSEKALKKNVCQAAEELGVNIELEQVSDIPSILKAGVLAIPAMAIEEQIMTNGYIPSLLELKDLLIGYHSVLTQF